VVVVGLAEVLRGMQSSRFLVFAILLVLIMLFRPQGLWPRHRSRRAPFVGLEDEEVKAEAARAFRLKPAVAEGAVILRVEGLVQRLGGVRADDEVCLGVRRAD